MFRIIERSREQNSSSVALRSALKGDSEGRLPGSRESLDILFLKETPTDIIVMRMQIFITKNVIWFPHRAR